MGFERELGARLSWARRSLKLGLHAALALHGSACLLPKVDVSRESPQEAAGPGDGEDDDARAEGSGAGASGVGAGRGGVDARGGGSGGVGGRSTAGTGGGAGKSGSAAGRGGAPTRGGTGGSQRAGAGGTLTHEPMSGAGGASSHDSAGASAVAAGSGDVGPCNASVCMPHYPCEIRGASYTCRGQFVDWSVMPTTDNWMVDDTKGIVTDLRCGLVWQRTSDTRTRGWDDSQAYCAGLSLAGGSWRLPTKAELESLVDDTKYNPSIDATAFPNTAATYFWTSSPLADSPGFAWYISFQGGDSRGSDTIFPTYARCVRSTGATFPSSGNGGAPPTRYTASMDGTVLDTSTHLRWQRDVDASTYTQPNAQSYCSSLELAGATWRLPTRAELLTLVDPTHYGPSVDVATFAATPAEFFWTASVSANDSGAAWTVSYTSGGTKTDMPSQAYRVRCVSAAP